MKKFLLRIGFYLVSCVFVFGSAQSPQWIWAKSAKSSSIIYGSEGTNAFSDNSGNIYITGIFNGPTISFDTHVLNCSGYTDAFLVKYDSLGNVLWAKRPSGTGNDLVYGLATDNDDNVYIAGAFASNVLTFDTFHLLNSQTGKLDFFLAKYNSAGKVLWAKKGGYTGDDMIMSIATDPFGNIYVTGYFDSIQMKIDSITLYNADTTGSKGDVFIAKYDSSGNFIWAKRAGGKNMDYGTCVATDREGNLYTGGIFSNDSIVFDSITLFNTGNYDMYLVKYDTSGLVIWALSSSGGFTEDPFDIVTDSRDNIYVTGYFNSSVINLGNDTLHNLLNQGQNDAFLVKYNSSGNFIWSKGVGGSKGDESYSVAVDNNDNVYISGGFRSSIIVIDSIPLYYPEHGIDVMYPKDWTEVGHRSIDLGLSFSKSNSFSSFLFTTSLSV
ncbi:MAG: SBBP repeat-containing protein [Bacteroidetes bacterium]|nr:SBBP repeat-containing protein [Bacteroidota bacterium]